MLRHQIQIANACMPDALAVRCGSCGRSSAWGSMSGAARSSIRSFQSGERYAVPSPNTARLQAEIS